MWECEFLFHFRHFCSRPELAVIGLVFWMNMYKVHNWMCRIIKAISNRIKSASLSGLLWKCDLRLGEKFVCSGFGIPRSEARIAMAASSSYQFLSLSYRNKLIVQWVFTAILKRFRLFHVEPVPLGLAVCRIWNKLSALWFEVFLRLLHLRYLLSLKM